MAGEALPQAPNAGALPAPRGELAPAGEALSGPRKAAVLMAALGSERAATVLAKLGEEGIEALSLEMAKLDAGGAETTESVIGEMAKASGRPGGVTSGGLEFAREVIE